MQRVPNVWTVALRVTVNTYNPSCLAVSARLSMDMILPAMRHRMPTGEYLQRTELRWLGRATKTLVIVTLSQAYAYIYPDTAVYPYYGGLNHKQNNTIRKVYCAIFRLVPAGVVGISLLLYEPYANESSQI